MQKETRAFVEILRGTTTRWFCTYARRFDMNKCVDAKATLTSSAIVYVPDLVFHRQQAAVVLNYNAVTNTVTQVAYELPGTSAFRGRHFRRATFRRENNWFQCYRAEKNL
jgi:hypothetical protein